MPTDVPGNRIVQKRFFLNPRDVDRAPGGLQRSRRAVLPCGALREGDVIWLKGARCGRILQFYAAGQSIGVEAMLFPMIGNDPRYFRESGGMPTFVDASELVDACTWHYDGVGVLKVCIPPIALVERL